MGRCEGCRRWECACATPEEAEVLRQENKDLGERIQDCLEALEKLYRGEWATNVERDQLIDEAWKALKE